MKTFIVLFGLLLNSCAFYTIDPGHRGVKVTLGSMDKDLKGEGFGLKLPMVTSVTEISIKQQTKDFKTEAYSADLQQVDFFLTVTYRVPESSVLKIFSEFSGNSEDTLLVPRVSEALKQFVSAYSAEQMVKSREKIKSELIQRASDSVKGLLIIENIAITNVDLSDQLEKAIEAKMVQEQEAEKSKYIKQKAQIEAETAIIKAEGEAKALAIQGEAIRKNPETMQMELIKKWNGVSPQVVGGGNGTNIILPLKEHK